MKDKLPIILAILLYSLILFLRWQQGGWEIKTEVFKTQRQALDQRISQFLPSPQAELLSGILLGQNKDLPGQLRLSLRDTSTLHIVVASGQNLSMLAGLLLSLAPLIKRRNAILFSLLAVILYTLLTGLQVPILRAAVMFTLASVAQLFGRQKQSVWVLIVTAALMLLINPNWAFELSFQLSFMATFGVIAVAPILLKKLRSIPVLGQDLAVTLGAQLMVTPIILQNFHQLSLVSVFTNLLVGWTVPFIMILGSIFIILSFISTTLASFVSFLANAFLTYFINMVSFFSSLPFAWEYIGEKNWIVWLGYYLVLAGVLVALNKLEVKNSN